MAIQVAGEYDVSPWEALLLQVRIAANRAAWLDVQLAEATRAADGDPMGSVSVRRLLRESRAERLAVGRLAKAAVDAGVAERMVRHVELEGRLLADALAAGLDAAELTPEQRFRALGAAQEHLLGAESPLLGGKTSGPAAWTPQPELPPAGPSTEPGFDGDHGGLGGEPPWGWEPGEGTDDGSPEG